MVGKPESAEMHPGPGFRIRSERRRPEADLRRTAVGMLDAERKPPPHDRSH